MMLVSYSSWHLPPALTLLLVCILSFGCESFQIGTSFPARKQRQQEPTNPSFFRRSHGGAAQVSSVFVFQMARKPKGDDPFAMFTRESLLECENNSTALRDFIDKIITQATDSALPSQQELPVEDDPVTLMTIAKNYLELWEGKTSGAKKATGAKQLTEEALESINDRDGLQKFIEDVAKALNKKRISKKQTSTFVALKNLASTKLLLSISNDPVALKKYVMDCNAELAEIGDKESVNRKNLENLKIFAQRNLDTLGVKKLEFVDSISNDPVALKNYVMECDAELAETGDEESVNRKNLENLKIMAQRNLDALDALADKTRADFVMSISNDPVALKKYVMECDAELAEIGDEESVNRKNIQNSKQMAQRYLDALDALADKTRTDFVMSISNDPFALIKSVMKCDAELLEIGDEESVKKKNIQDSKQTAQSFLVTLGAKKMEFVDSISNDPVALKNYVMECDAELLKIGDEESAYKNYTEKAKKYAKEKLDKLFSPTSPSNRIAPISFGVESEELIHDYDLNRLLDYVLRLFDWHNDPKIQNKFMAPYFPLVQASGSGKTKLLWELRKLINNDENKSFSQFTCRTILCMDSSPNDNATSIFSTYLTVGQDPPATLRDRICENLDKILGQCEEDKIIFLFDEAQHLLLNDGYAFRCVRWWLRRIRIGSQKQVVAVFTGTTSRLTNFYAEPRQSSTTRDASKNHHDEGTVLYDPFFSLFTTGIFAAGARKDSGLNEYERAIPYGRPLFAALSKSNQMEESKLVDVLDRMLLIKNQPRASWDKNLAACFSILGTRVQVGQTSVALVSELISSGYGWLTHFAVSSDGREPTSPRICFKPDPVCARLAMCMMDPDWSTTSSVGSTFQGQSKTFWTSKISEIFSTGLCMPNQGDVGEIAGASYLLFCGDELRKRIDSNYTTFSVPLESFVEGLLQNESDDLDLTSTETSPSSNQQPLDDLDLTSTETIPSSNQQPLDDLNLTSTETSPSSNQQQLDDLLNDLDLTSTETVPSSNQQPLDDLNLTSTETSPSSNQQDELKYADAHVNFIQVVRNYFRFPIQDLEGLGILEDMYNAGIAYYSYPNCPVFDMVVSIRLTKLDGTFRFIPMIVSISTTKGGQAINSATLIKMTNALKKTDMSMGIRLVFGETHNNATERLSMEDTTHLLRGGNVSKVLVVPRNDQFGIVKLLLETVSDGPVRNEIYSSDFFALSPRLQGDYNHTRMLRTSALQEQKNDLKEIIEKDFGSTQKRKPTSKPKVQPKIGGNDLVFKTGSNQATITTKKKRSKRPADPPTEG